MNRELPTPSNILEQLADKVVVGIDNLAVTAFKAALDEMTRYHQFLLNAYTKKTAEGAAFSYAEIRGELIAAPHEEWIRQYRRLFERAADALNKDSDFIGTLAYLPLRLLPRRATDFSPAIISTILDLGPILVTRLESWVTRRVTVDNPTGESASPRLVLAGSDKAAYSEALLEVVGGWESILQFVGSFYGWKEVRNLPPDVRWPALSRSWPFLKRHIRNTAYFVSSAVWNEDEIGAMQFRDALLRWSRVFEFELPDPYYSRYRFLLFPDIFSLNWAAAEARTLAIEGNDALPHEIDPFSLAATLLGRVHDDVIVITAAVVLRWYIDQKQSSDIAVKICRQLLNRELVEPDAVATETRIGFGFIFFTILRFDVAGERFEDENYGGFLDGLISSLDQMSERRVVPGRIYTPSTMGGRHDLVLPFLSILLAHIPDGADDQLVNQVGDAVLVPSRFPQGDRSLHNMAHLIRALLESLKANNEDMKRAAKALSETIDLASAVPRLAHLLERSADAIDRSRTDRIKAASIDPMHLERIRRRAERAFTTTPAGVQIFNNFQIKLAGFTIGSALSDVRIRDLPKGLFTNPPMEWGWVQLDENIIARLTNWSAGNIWPSFWALPRRTITVGSRPTQKDFWIAIAGHAIGLDQSPTLLLSVQGARQVLMEWSHFPNRRPAGLLIERKAVGERGTGAYIVSIEGVDVYDGGARFGRPILFSSSKLKSITYKQLSAAGNILQLNFMTQDDPWKLSLEVKMAQVAEWDDSPVLEFDLPAPQNAGEDC